MSKRTLFTIKDLAEFYNKTVEEVLFDTTYDESHYPIPLKDSFNRSLVANYIEENCDLYDLLEKYKDTTKNQYEHLSKNIKFLLYRNKVNIEKYWALYGLDYDPIANYDKTSTISTQYGEHTTDTKLGERTDSSTLGASTTTSTNKVSNYDSNTMYDRDSNTFSGGSRTDSSTTGEENNQLISRTHTDTVTERTTGNIGVTTTQQMMTSEIELIDNMKFFDYIKNLILSYVCNSTMIVPTPYDCDDEYYQAPITIEGLNIGIATTSKAGLVKPGENMTILEDGTINFVPGDISAEDISYKTTNVEDALDGIAEDIANVETRIDELDAINIHYDGYLSGVQPNVDAYLRKHQNDIDIIIPSVQGLASDIARIDSTIQAQALDIEGLDSSITTINSNITDINTELGNRAKVRYVERDSTLFNSIINANSWGAIINLIDNIGDSLLLSLRAVDRTTMINNGLLPNDTSLGGYMEITRILSTYLLVKGYVNQTYYQSNQFVALTNTPNWYKFTGTKI